jgi:hypothetical protein
LLSANGGFAAMVVDGGGGNGVFAAAFDDHNMMVGVAIMSLVNGGSGDGHPCRRLRQRSMAAAEMAALTVAASAVDGGSGNDGLR